MPLSGKKLVLWMCAVVVAALLIIDGALRVFQLNLMVAQFERFGYGLGALRAFGGAELLAGLLLLTPPVRLLAAGLAALLMAMAVFAYVSTGAGFPAAPITVAVLCLALIWMHLEQRLPRAGKP
jgi:uncharacterized membrane protein YphA (DoxX/SURF4 family)